MGEALCRAVRGRQRDPGALALSWACPAGKAYSRDACGAVD